MKLHRKLIDYTISTKPYSITSAEGHRPARRWIFSAMDGLFAPSITAPQPRIIEGATPNTATVYLPSQPYYRMRVIINNTNITSTGRFVASFYTEPLDYVIALDNPLPSNNYAIFDYNATQYAGNDYKPSLHRLYFSPSDPINTFRLCDIAAYSYALIEPYLTDLTTVSTQYDVSVFAPLGYPVAVARAPNTRAYKLSLLVPRDVPDLQYLTSLTEGEQMEMEIDGRYIPCVVHSRDAQPMGGALWNIQLQLAATSLYAYNPIRYIKPQTHTSQLDKHSYNLPGDAPTPAEIRLLITAVPTNPDLRWIRIHAPAAGAAIKLFIDEVGTWSIHDTGRIYHIPSANPRTLIDRTDVLREGALPIVLLPGEGYIALEHAPDYGIPNIAIAAYPRYLLETTL